MRKLYILLLFAVMTVMTVYSNRNLSFRANSSKDTKILVLLRKTDLRFISHNTFCFELTSIKLTAEEIFCTLQVNLEAVSLYLPYHIESVVD